jgi:hypothetical protein
VNNVWTQKFTDQREKEETKSEIKKQKLETDTKTEKMLWILKLLFNLFIWNRKNLHFLSHLLNPLLLTSNKTLKACYYKKKLEKIILFSKKKTQRSVALWGRICLQAKINFVNEILSIDFFCVLWYQIKAIRYWQTNEAGSKGRNIKVKSSDR